MHIENAYNKHQNQQPEEIVRLHLIQYLCVQKGVPLSLVEIEKEFVVYSTRRRYDAVVFNNNGEPLLLAECKAPTVILGSSTFQQAAIYNVALHAPYMLITNGNHAYCSRVEFDTKEVVFLEEIPTYQEMITSIQK
jgi:hypothetical protein